MVIDLSDIIVAAIGLLGTIIASYFGYKKGKKPEAEDPKISHSPEVVRREYTYDVFISAPLAAFNSDADMKADHDRIVPLVEYFENELGLNVFWAGRNISGKDDFDPADISARKDIHALRDSKYFLLLYPGKILSSVIFEAGIALRTCLVSIYLVKDQDDLPFLMKNAPQAFKNVRIYTANLPGGALKLVRQYGRYIFDVESEPADAE